MELEVIQITAKGISATQHTHTHWLHIHTQTHTHTHTHTTLQEIANPITVCIVFNVCSANTLNKLTRIKFDFKTIKLIPFALSNFEFL